MPYSGSRPLRTCRNCATATQLPQRQPMLLLRQRRQQLCPQPTASRPSPAQRAAAAATVWLSTARPSPAPIRPPPTTVRPQRGEVRRQRSSDSNWKQQQQRQQLQQQQQQRREAKRQCPIEQLNTCLGHFVTVVVI